MRSQESREGQYGEAIRADRDQAVIDWMDSSPYDLRAALLSEEYQQRPRDFAVLAAAASLQARVGEQRAALVLDRKCRAAIRSVLVQRNRTGESYLFNIAAEEVAGGEPHTADLILVANSAQHIHPTSQPYRQGRVVRHIHHTPTNLDDTLLSLIGLDRPQKTLAAAVRRFVSSAPDFAQVRSDGPGHVHFASGSPLNVLLAQLAIVRRLGLYEGLDVTVEDPIRTFQFQQLQACKEAALRPGNFQTGYAESGSANYMKLLPGALRREIDAVGQYVDDRHAYLQGYPMAAKRETRLWRGLSPDGSGWHRLESAIHAMEERAPMCDARYGLNVTQSAEYLTAELEAALRRQDAEAVTTLWAIIQHRQHRPEEREKMQALAKAWQPHVSRVAEPYLVDLAHLAQENRTVPRYVAPLLADFYFSQHDKYRAAYGPEYVTILTPVYGSLAEDREMAAKALRAMLPKGEKYTAGSAAFDLAVAWRLVAAQKPYEDQELHKQVAADRFRMVVARNRRPHSLTPRLHEAYDAYNQEPAGNGIGRMALRSFTYRERVL